jgi:hypothetical protein
LNENWLQIRSYKGKGFQPLVIFNDWRVAILNYMDEIHPENNNRMERHTKTDEVFVLAKGQAVLIVGGNYAQVDMIFPQVMEVGKLYNVRVNTWHTILLSRDASVLIVEELDTGEQNSEYLDLPAILHQQIIETARREQIGF